MGLSCAEGGTQNILKGLGSLNSHKNAFILWLKKRKTVLGICFFQLKMKRELKSGTDPDFVEPEAVTLRETLFGEESSKIMNINCKNPTQSLWKSLAIRALKLRRH